MAVDANANPNYIIEITMINLNNAAKYYNAEQHQIDAFDYLQERLTSEELGVFAHLYRTPVAKPRVSPPAANNTQFLEIIKQRIDELDIKMYSTGSKGWGYTVVGISGVNGNLSRNSNALDKWNDIVVGIKVYTNGKWEMIGPFMCTTDPGAYYTKVRVLNPLGAARVKPDVKHNAVWQLGWHKDQKDCLVQTGGPITVVRDSNKDGKISDGEQEQQGWFGINLHHSKGNYNPNSIGRWSAGCLVLPNVQQHAAIVNGFKDSGQRKCSYVLLDGSKL